MGTSGTFTLSTIGCAASRSQASTEVATAVAVSQCGAEDAPIENAAAGRPKVKAVSAAPTVPECSTA